MKTKSLLLIKQIASGRCEWGNVPMRASTCGSKLVGERGAWGFGGV